MKKRKVWFTIDLDAELRKAGVDTNERFGKIEIYDASQEEPEPEPERSSIFVDESGRLRLN